MSSLILPVGIRTNHADDLQVNTQRTFRGRFVEEIRDFFCELGRGLVEGAKKIASYVGRLFRDSACLGRVCRLGVNAFALIERCIGKPGLFSAVGMQLATTESMVSAAGVGEQIQYFGTGKQNEESLLASLGQGALLAAGIAGVSVLIGQLVLHGFTAVGFAVGSHAVFGSVLQYGLQTANGLAAVGFLALACDSTKKIAEANTSREKVQGILNLVWAISEIAFSVLGATGSSHFIATIALGSVAAGLGFVSFLYGLYVEDQKNAAQINNNHH